MRASRCALERRSLAGLRVRTVAMDFSYKDAFGRSAEAYERSCLTRSTATRRCSSAPTRWNRLALLEPIQDAFVEGYPTSPLRRGHVGTLEAARLLEPDGYEWVNP